MPRNIRLMLTGNVDNLGIVGDVVNVRSGYARNYLLPRGLATEPSDDAVAAIAERRKEAERELAELRRVREGIIAKLEGHEITLTRSCNDQGVLYGAVTQQDIAQILTGEGFAVRPREVRLPATIKRVDNYDVLVKFDSDLEANVKLHVVADRELDLQREKAEMDFDEEGNLIEPGSAAASRQAERDAERASRGGRRGGGRSFLDNPDLTKPVEKGFRKREPAPEKAPEGEPKQG